MGQRHEPRHRHFRRDVYDCDDDYVVSRNGPRANVAVAKRNGSLGPRHDRDMDLTACRGTNRGCLGKPEMVRSRNLN
jgi:hypothetical protein